MMKFLVLAVLVAAVQSQSTWSPGVPDARCPSENGDFPVFIPHVDCTRYWKCNSGFRFEMRCPVGLHFNASKNVCDLPSEAGCNAARWRPGRPFEAVEEEPAQE